MNVLQQTNIMMSNNTVTTTYNGSTCSNNNSNSKNNNNIPIIRRRTKSIQERDERKKQGLLLYAKDITSQNGEDGILEKIFDLINNKNCMIASDTSNTTGITIPYSAENSDIHGSSNSTKNNEKDIRKQDYNVSEQRLQYWCVDIGAWDGIHLSNTRQLLTQKNPYWNGMLIEADDLKFQQLQSLYSSQQQQTNNFERDNNDYNNSESEVITNQVVHCIHEMVSCDTSSSSSICNILQKQSINLPYNFDFLCIDIDGLDYWILYDILHTQSKDANKTYRPRVICIEYNPTMPNDMIYIPARDDTIRHGCSLAALYELLVDQYDYVLVVTTLYNAIFVDRVSCYESCIGLQNLVPDTTLETLTDQYQHSMGTTLYQLYDGTIQLWGCKKLLWHRVPITESMIPFEINNDNNYNNEKHNKIKNGISNKYPSHHQSRFPFEPNTHRSGSQRKQRDENALSNTVVVDVSSYCRFGRSNEDDGKEETDTNTASAQQEQEQQQSMIECSNQLVQQLQKDGFCYIRGTGISRQQLCQPILYWTDQFLHLSNESIRRSCLSKYDRARRGYSPSNTENFSSLLVSSSVSSSFSEKSSTRIAHNDLVRKFRIGDPSIPLLEPVPRDFIEKPNHDIDTDVSKLGNSTPTRRSLDNILFQPNIWPTSSNKCGNNKHEQDDDDDDYNSTWNDDDTNEFRSSVEQYYEHADIVAQHVLHALCDGLKRQYPHLTKPLHIFREGRNTKSSNGASDVVDEEKTTPNNTIDHSNTEYSSSILTLLGYQNNTSRHKGKHQGNPLVAAHTDVGIITMLLFDKGDCAVLQRAEYETITNNASNEVPAKTRGKWVDITLPDPMSEGNIVGNDSDDPVFVINIADCFSDIVGGVIPSTLHRVVPKRDQYTTSSKKNRNMFHDKSINNHQQLQPQQKRRNCCALFVGLHPQDVIEVNNESITYEEWRRRRIDRAQSQLIQQRQQPQQL